MPRKSVKEEIIEALIEDFAQEIITNAEIMSDNDIDEELLDELDDNISIAIFCRRGISYSVSTSDVWRNNVLTAMDDNRFKQMLRVERDQFMEIVDLIKDAKEFNGPHCIKQYSVELQLAVVLFRLGSSGESAAFRKIGSIFGVGDGGTIVDFTKRIFKVLLRFQSKYIYWPNEKERSEIVFDTLEELPFCIGYIDGTEIKIAETPIVNPVQYFSRNRIYSIKAQVVCDHKLQIRQVVVGHPGSWHDARIYRNTTLFKKNEDYFSNQQWIAGDSAYPLSKTMLTPYRSNAKQLNRNARIEFNLRHSRYRVRIEHCFGLLKERFGSLKELRMRIRSKENHKHCCDWFIICCILHNMLMLKTTNSSDLVNNIEGTFTEDELIDPEEHSSTIIEGEIKRQAIYSLIKN